MNEDPNNESTEIIRDHEKKPSQQSDIYVSMHLNEEFTYPTRENHHHEQKDSISNLRQSAQVDVIIDQFIKSERKSSIESNVSTAGNLTKELITRVARKQTVFNLLIVGESGLGKRTFVKSILSKHKTSTENSDDLYEKTAGTLVNNYLYEKSFDLQIDRQKLLLKVIEVPEFGMGLQADSTFDDVENYVNVTFEEHFRMECSINRKFIVDRKIHCCLYFVSPYGHGLRPLDIEFIKQFRCKFNIILVIAKSDIFNKTELEQFKSQLWRDLEKNQIDLFQYLKEFEHQDDEDYENLYFVSQEIQKNIPFAVISSPKIDSDGKSLRQYPWGDVNCNDSNISSIQALDQLLFKSHTNYFRKMTKNVYYENFRVQYILDRVQ